MDPLMVVLRVLHIGAGILWVGAAWTFFLFVNPTLRALGPDTEKNFMGYVTRQRRVTQVILVATLITVGAGAAMYWIDWQNYGPLWLQTGFGIGITIGAVAAIVAFALGPTLIAPAFEKMAELGAQIDAAGGPPSAEQMAEMNRLGERLRRVFVWDFGLLVVAVLFMATARYMGGA